MAVSEELIVRIRGDLSDVQAKLGQLDSRVNRSASNAQSQFAAMGRALTAAFAGIATLAAARGFANLVTTSLAAAESIKDMADRANVGTEFLQEMRDVANQAGASTRDFDDAISRLNRRLGLFIQSGGGPAAQAFRDLGLEGRIATGELQDAESVFYAIAEAIEEVGTQAERSALLSQVFGEDAGPRLLSMLSMGVDGINRAAQAARDGGRVIEDSLVTQASAASDALERMNDQFSAEVNTAIAENVDQIVTVGEALATVAGSAIDATARIVEFLGALNDLPDYREQTSGLNSIIDDIAAGDLRNRTGIRTRLRTTLGQQGGERFFSMIRDLPREAGGRSEFYTEESLGRIVALMSDVARGREAMARASEGLADAESRVHAEVTRAGAALGRSRDAADDGEASFGRFLDRMQDGVDQVRDFRDHLDGVQYVLETLPANLSHFEEQTKEKMASIAAATAEAGQQFEKFAVSVEAVADDATQAVQNSFVLMAQGIRVTFEDLARDLAGILARAAFNQWIATPLTNAFSSALGAIPGFGTSGSAPITAGGTMTTGSAGPTVYIDARGATPGVEEKIEEVLARRMPTYQRQAAGLAVSSIATIRRKRTIG